MLFELPSWRVSVCLTNNRCHYWIHSDEPLRVCAERCFDYLYALFANNEKKEKHFYSGLTDSYSNPIYNIHSII